MLAPTARLSAWHNPRFRSGFAVLTALRHPVSRPGLVEGWLAHAFRAPRPLRDWLTDRGSLTRLLSARHTDFRVRPLRRGAARPHPDERRSLGLARGELAYVRDVLLVGDGRNRVFAHSVLARASLAGGWHRITRLGARPLGEALFSDPRVRRRGLVVRKLDARHPLHRAACRGANIAAPALWARRSVFCLGGRPLLVTEVFLPDLP